jgi:hypothetical protein
MLRKAARPPHVWPTPRLSTVTSTESTISASFRTPVIAAQNNGSPDWKSRHSAATATASGALSREGGERPVVAVWVSHREVTRWVVRLVDELVHDPHFQRTCASHHLVRSRSHNV